MAFITLTAVPSAAVASGATIAFTLPFAAQWGQAKLEGGHTLYARGLQAKFTHPQDFTVSASGATVTVTYNGTTSLPANQLVTLQLEVPGENDWMASQPEALKDVTGAIRCVLGRPVRVLFGAVAAASNTAVVNAGARSGTNTVTTYATPVTLDVPRGLRYVSSNAGDTTQTVTVTGTDEFGVTMSEIVTLNGTTAVLGKKAFKTVISDKVSATLAGTLSIGTQAGVLGLPFFLPGGTSAGAGYVLKEIQDGAVATAGTFVGGDLTKATTSTGDVRGTWTPNAAPDTAKVYEIVIMATDLTFKGVTQA